MSDERNETRDTDEWRVEVRLDREASGSGFAKRLHDLRLDDAARGRLGGAVIVTRDGGTLFLYAWHELSAREAERTVRDLLEEDELAGEVELTRWHPAEEAWRPASEALPSDEDELAAERERHHEAAERERESSGRYEWEVAIELAGLPETLELARELEGRGLAVRRRWRYVLVGAATEEDATDLAQELEPDLPEGSHLGVRANPAGLPAPEFVLLASLKPGPLRDLGL